MTEQTAEQTIEYSQSELDTLNAHFRKAFDSFIDTQKTLNDAGVSPTAIASALAASYVSLVAAIASATGQGAEHVIPTCQGALESLDEFVTMAYDRMTKINEESAE